jgi:hypothetical protein
MKHTRLNPQQQERTAAGRQEVQQPTAREFASVEEMLRHDVLHTPVPPAIVCKLQKSIAQIPAAAQPWWRRLFGSRH